MQTIRWTFIGFLLLLTILWLVEEPSVFQPASLFALRAQMMQYTGIIAIGCMSLAMILALRPRWPERRLGGLDKMYRLHKWLGVAALIAAVAHWLWSEGVKWAVGYGWIARPVRGQRAAIDNSIEAFLGTLRGSAEGLGEWAFYAAVILIMVALVRYFPYRFFYKTHRLLAIVYLVLVFHTVVLTTFGYWTAPVGILQALLLAYGTWAAIVILFRRVGTSRQVEGEIAAIRYYPGVRSLETEIDVGEGWPGHAPGQFAFATSSRSEGAHPYTIASAWKGSGPRITFITKELGDHTRRLRQKLDVGQKVTIEGPYGCFTFDDARPRQIWIGGGIGITPFVAQMKRIAAEIADGQGPERTIDLFHSTADYDEEAIRRLTADAEAARVSLHVMVDSRDGLLTGDRIRAEVPDWREASIWFCGPTGFGRALRKDLAAQGFDVRTQFHQELFAMR